MEIQKLNWAGIRLTSHHKTILIDAVEDFSYYKPVLGDAVENLLEFSEHVQADYILFTHLHLDHFDKGVIRKCLKKNGKLIVYTALESVVKKLVDDVEIIAAPHDAVMSCACSVLRVTFQYGSDSLERTIRGV